MTETIVPEGRLMELAVRALVNGAMAQDEAALAAQVSVMADMFGLRTHGILRIPQYLNRVRLGGIDPRAKVTVERVAPGVALVDGKDGVGTLVGMRALEAAREGARNAGIGAAFVRASNHFGPIAPYAYLAAQDGFASIIGSNASTTIAPFGGRDTRLGNNPLGIAVPNPGGDPIMLDMAMSVAARGRMRALRDRGESMPEGWATDRDGRPTTDPAAGLAGFILPFGGYKGYGLAVMVDMLAGLLSGGGYLTHVNAWDKTPEKPSDNGHFYILIDTARLGSSAWLKERIDDFTAILRSTPPADPSVPVMAPGDREMAAYHRAKREGVRVATADLAALEKEAAT